VAAKVAALKQVSWEHPILSGRAGWTHRELPPALEMAQLLAAPKVARLPANPSWRSIAARFESGYQLNRTPY